MIAGIFPARNEDLLMVTYEHEDAGHTRRVTVTRSDVGWEIREEQDSQVVRTSRHTDWHRVERALRLIEQAIAPRTLRRTVG